MIERVEEATDEVVAALERLVPQLSPARVPPTIDEVIRVAHEQTLLVARDAAGKIVGTLTLVLYAIPTGVRARIEDVIVDEASRGQGVGEELTREAIELARAARAEGVDLTSSPAREGANRLYRRLGFEQRETNVYRLSFQPRRP